MLASKSTEGEKRNREESTILFVNALNIHDANKTL